MKQGRVAALPTDTVYGFLGHAEQKETVDKIFDIKDRDRNNPIGIFVKDLSMAKRYAEISEEQEALLRQYWPGRITFVLSKRREFPSGIGTEDTIGIRVPEYELLNTIFQKINFPLAQTSANISGRPSPLDSKTIIREFKNRGSRPDLVLDNGETPLAHPSTVVDLSAGEPKLIRQGEVKFKPEV